VHPEKRIKGFFVNHQNYAVVKIFGRQFKVFEGMKIKANYIKAEPGTSLSFSEVLVLKKENELKIGEPTVAGASVQAEIISHGREDKILVFKYLRKNKSKKMRGHRQDFTTLSIKSIEL
jgi:large subunit ribosomal protein L21